MEKVSRRTVLTGGAAITVGVPVIAWAAPNNVDPTILGKRPEVEMGNLAHIRFRCRRCDANLEAYADNADIMAKSAIEMVDMMREHMESNCTLPDHLSNPGSAASRRYLKKGKSYG